MKKTGLEEAQAGIKIARRIINNLRYADDTTLMAESEEELKSLLMKVKEESENWSRSVVSNSLRPHGLQPTRLLCPWDFPGKSTGVGCHYLLRESEKVGLKLNIQKTKIMASGAITSWEIDGETVETVSDFILGGSKITTDGDCSHEIKRHLLLGEKL